MVLLAIAALGLALPPGAAAAPGDLDATFGSGGVTSLASVTTLNAVAVQADREVVAVGSSGSSLLVQRFSAAGSPQSPFAAGSGVGRGVAVQADGKIVVAGTDAAGMLVERFNANGSLDRGFGSAGVVHAVPGARANALALGPGGTIVVAGQETASDSFQRVIVLRLGSSGSPDPSLGAGGVRLVDLGEDSVAKSVAVQGDGKIVLAGSIGPGTHQGASGFVARLTPAGPLDTSFASGGAFISNPQAGGADSTLNAVALDPAGGIVVGGGSTATNQSQALIGRLTCAGAPDASFAGTGLLVTPSSRGFVTDPLGVNSVAVGAARHVVAAGVYRDSGLNLAALSGFESSGSADFANQAPSGAEALGLVVDSAGSLVVAGTNIPAGFSPSGFVARYVGFGARASGTSPCGGSAASGAPPAVSTGPASALGASTATVSGSINPHGQQTSYHFEYGTSSAYGLQSAAASAGSGVAAVGASATLARLRPGTKYHYRLVASNVAGTVSGSDATFKTARTTPPSLPQVSQSHRRWGETKSRTRHRPVGTSFSFTLNEQARVSLTFSQPSSGRKVNRRCVAPTRRNRHKPACRRSVTKGSFSVNGHAGSNRIFFQGRISRSNRLGPGGYTVTILATNSAGQRSQRVSLSFTIVR